LPAPDPRAEVVKYATRGILLDANVLLVYVAGKMDPDRIERFKNIHVFTKKDYRFIEAFVANFARIVATPHILAEVSNLAGQLTEPAKGLCFDSFARVIEVVQEEASPAKDVGAPPCCGGWG
jgi:hypothetical protein